MDLNDYWQENKRFVMTVAGGVLAFALGEMLIGSFLGDELASKRGEIRRAIADLGKPRYGPADLSTVRDENEALAAARSTLEERVAFQPRPGFALVPGSGSPTNQYFGRVEAVRERLVRDAGRAGMRLDDGLGLPPLAPTREEEIVRHLEALDLVERVCDIALETGVERIDDIAIELDRGLLSGRESGPFEKTEITMKMSGPSRPIVQFLAATQDPSRGPSLLIDDLLMTPRSGKAEEAELAVTFVTVRLRSSGEES